MTLYEIGNGHIGESFVRVYVVAENEFDAMLLARHAFSVKYPDSIGKLKITASMECVNGKCSSPSDAGLEIDA